MGAAFRVTQRVNAYQPRVQPWGSGRGYGGARRFGVARGPPVCLMKQITACENVATGSQHRVLVIGKYCFVYQNKLTTYAHDSHGLKLNDRLSIGTRNSEN